MVWEIPLSKVGVSADSGFTVTMGMWKNSRGLTVPYLVLRSKSY